MLLLEDQRPVKVRAYPNPFEADYDLIQSNHGASIGDIVRSIFPEDAHEIIMLHVRAWLGGVEVRQPFFDLVKPKRGQLVVVKLQPAEGLIESGAIGKPQIATGVSILTSAGGLILQGAIGGPAGIAASIGLALLGVMLASALVPPPVALPEAMNNTVSNFRNALEAGGILSQPFGLMRVWPKHGARPFTIVDGNTQKLIAIFAIGQGEYDLSDFRIGNTSTDEFEGLYKSVRSGGIAEELSTFQPFTLYTEDVDQVLVGADLDADPAADQPLADDWVVRSTSVGVQQITVALEFPDGLYEHTEFATRHIDVHFAVEFKANGSIVDDDEPWIQVADRIDIIGAGGFDDATNVAVFSWLSTIETNMAAAIAAIDLIDLGDQVITQALLDHMTEAVLRIEARIPDIQTTTGGQNLTLLAIDQNIDLWETQSAGYTIGTESERVASFQEQIDLLFLINSAIEVLLEINNYTLQGQGDDLSTYQFWHYWMQIQASLPFIIVHEAPGNWRVTRAERGIARAERSWFTMPGKYDVRVRRVSNESPGQESIHERAVWSTLSSRKPQSPLPEQGVSTVEIEVTATNQVVGFLESFSCLAHSILRVWDEVQSEYEDWPKAATSNPAWIYCAILMGPTARNPLTQARVDVEKMKEWADFCDSESFEFNGTFSRDQTLFDALKAVATVGRARPILRDQRWSVVIDKPLTGPPVQLISPRNSWGFTSSRALRDLPHAIKVGFNDADLDYAPSTRIVYNDGFDETNTTVYETITAFGVTSADQAWRMGRYFYRVAILRPEVIEVNMDIENIVLEVGDLARIGHWVNLWGSGQGLIKTLIGGDPYTGVTVDDAFPMESGKDYAVRGRKSDGTIFLANVDTVAGDQTTLTFESTQTGIAVGDLLMYGEQTLETQSVIVHSIRFLPGNAARMTLVEEAPLVHETGTIPPYDPLITHPPIIRPQVPSAPIVSKTVTDEEALILGRDGTIESRIQLHFQRPATLGGGVSDEIAGVQSQLRVTGATEEWDPVAVHTGDIAVVSIGPVVDGIAYDVRTRYATVIGVAGPWSTLLDVLVIGKGSPPPDVESFFRHELILRWNYYNPPLDLAGFEIRSGNEEFSQWEQAIPIHSGVITDLVFALDNVPPGERTYFIKAKDTSDNYSTNAATITVNIGDLETANAIRETELHPAWPGEIFGADIDPVSGDIIAHGTNDQMYGAPFSPLYVGEGGDVFYAGTFEELTYRFAYDPLSQNLPASLRFDVDIAADTWAIQYGRGDWVEVDQEDSSDQFWNDDLDDLFWVSDLGWETMPNGIQLEDFIYSFRLVTFGTTSQARVSGVTIVDDAPDITEYLNDVSIASGGADLSPAKTYREITHVTLTIQTVGGETAVASRVNDKDFDGPEVECFDAAGNTTAGTVDAFVRGY